jgi:hypothetical protein
MKMSTTTSSAFKIENVAIRRKRLEERNIYPFAKMKVGQSFFIDAAHVGDMPSIRATATFYQRRDGTKFSILREGNGYRCGRVK